ncbi:MAG TPA: ABC transporter permease [Campylobacterales bacterium]|nr:ABC transporter permease [Campylobacterales bacterium]
MQNKINFYLIEYAINAILRQKSKSIFITVVFIMLTFLLTTVFFITTSLKYELHSTVDSLPEITIQNIKAGRHNNIDTAIVDELLLIEGVTDVVARVWGYYYFENGGVNFTLIGIDEFENQYKDSFKKISFKSDSSMIVGAGVYKVLEKSFYKNYFNFIKPDGSFKKITISGVFNSELELESNDMIVMSKENIREIFDIPENRATDIVIKVANPVEINTITSKIRLKYPFARVITKEDLKVSYQNIFDYKSGIFLAMFIISIFTFFMIIYDKSSGLSSEEKREIGILKAVGWKIDDILKEKFYEASIISIFSYIAGVILAFGFVFLLQAPLLRDIFVGYSQLKTTFTLPFVFDFQTLFLVFFLSVPIYLAATIIPSWRVATMEVDEVIR